MHPDLFVLARLLRRPEPKVGTDPLKRFGLRKPSQGSLQTVVCTFLPTIVKRSVILQDVALQVTWTLNYLSLLVCKSCFLFAEDFLAEAVELGIFAQRFEPVEFSDFVNSQSAVPLPIVEG